MNIARITFELDDKLKQKIKTRAVKEKKKIKEIAKKLFEKWIKNDIEI